MILSEEGSKGETLSSSEQRSSACDLHPLGGIPKKKTSPGEAEIVSLLIRN